jgi:transcriptional regulator with XRE-family HTH domain
LKSDLDKELLEALGSNIRMMRHALGYSQEAFARHAGIDRGYMGCVERGERNLATLNLVKIARALGVPVGKLFKGIK